MVQAFDESGRLARRHFQFLHSALRVGIRKSTVGATMLGGVYFVAYSANALAF